ncbi:MAG: hypothetical protein ACI4MF_13630 [Candidatus Faecivicinus sp.]
MTVLLRGRLFFGKSLPAQHSEKPPVQENIALRFGADALEGGAICSSATRKFRGNIHFCIDELGMELWNARLDKRIGSIPVEDDGFAHHEA